jgi:hypothetical protein
MTMGMARALRGSTERWEAIRADVCSGKYSLTQVATKWRVSVGTIKSKSHREHWPTPAKVQEKKDAFLQVASDAVVQGLMCSELDPKSPEARALAGGLAQGVVPRSGTGLQPPDPLEYQMTMAKFAMALATDGVKTVPKPRNLREVALADTIARRALGLDSKGGASAAAMIRVTGANGQTVDIAAMAQADGGGEEWEDEED